MESGRHRLSEGWNVADIYFLCSSEGRKVADTVFLRSFLQKNNVSNYLQPSELHKKYMSATFYLLPNVCRPLYNPQFRPISVLPESSSGTCYRVLRYLPDFLDFLKKTCQPTSLSSRVHSAILTRIRSNRY